MARLLGKAVMLIATINKATKYRVILSLTKTAHQEKKQATNTKKHAANVVQNE